MVVVAHLHVTIAQDSDAIIHINVGVILDLETWVGKVSNSCMYMAISDFYAIHADYKTRLVLHTRDSKSDIVGAVFAVMDLLGTTQVEAIIGPQQSSQTEFIVDLGGRAQIPIVSFSATTPSLYSRIPYFIQTTPDDHTQVKAIASIAQAFSWRKVILIHEDTDYGNRLVPHLIDAFQEINVHISYRSVISTFASDDQIFEELQKLAMMQTSVFIVHMSASFGSSFFLKTKQMGMMTEGYVWIITNGLMNVLESLEPTVIDSMQGVIGVEPYIPKSQKLDNFITRWKRKFIAENTNTENAEMIDFGIWAYDTIWALAMAAERVGYVKSSFNKLEIGLNAIDLLGMNVSQTGPKLLEEILKIGFEGLSGKFNLVNRQLEPSAFQILNVIGKGGREIGVWMPKHGISRDLNLNSETAYSTSADQFRSIVWPGESTTKPKGWVIPMNGKKLRIGVPVQDGFSELVNVSGYCIGVFQSAISSLPYTIPYEFVPFQRDDGKSAGSYNDLIDQVYLQKYDAVVGDITITANRSLYVDFAFPYTDGGVWMIVPIKQYKESNNAWTFLHPLSKEFGISMGTFIITTFLVWFLEQGLLDKYRGKKTSSILSKFMVIIWLFLIIGLTLNSVVTLTSLLTLEQNEPTITDFNDLIRNGDFVGYRKGTFVIDLLKRVSFDESKLKPYNSPEECHELLSKGSQNGGVTAVFEEMPYIDIFLAKYCFKYAKVGPTHKTDGFGFVFPKGSPLVSDMSKAVLEVTEGNKLLDIEQAWFTPNTTCKEDKWAIFTSTNPSSLIQMAICILVLSLLITSTRSTSPTSFPVGVILDLGTATGKLCNSCIAMAVSDFYAVHGHYGTRLMLHTRNAENVVSAVFEAVDLLKDVEVHVIVGPQKSAQAEFVAELGNKSQVPVISFTATSPSLSRSHMPYFVRMTQNDTYQLEAIASIIQAFGWKEVVLIYEETDYGNGIIHFLLDAFQSIDVRVSYRSVINPLATEDEILKELHKLSTMKTRVFVVHMASLLGPLFFLKPYIPRSKERDNFRLRLMREIVHESATMDHDLNVFCLHAYDTIWMLAMAAEKLGRNYGFRQPARYKNTSTHSAEPGVSLYGPELLKEILRTKFKGVSGDIRLINGQIQPLVFQILNVVGMGEREVGFWIPKVGLSQHSETTRKKYKTSQTDLRPIIWPGESTIVPSVYMKKLKIGFPIKHSFTELVKLDLNKNKTIVSGYCIDIFTEVMKELPYNVPYELVPFQRANGESAGNYNNLVEQVSLQMYDAVIGDITITSHRSASVDFSLPFTIGGVSMLIPIKYEGNDFIIFNPFAWDVWLSGIGLGFNAFLIVFFFQIVNNSDPIKEQFLKIFKKSFWISSSTQTFPPEFGLKKASNFILTTTKIALSTLIVIFIQLFANKVTDEGLQLTIVDVHDLIKRGDFVGYQKGSYVETVLKQLNFHESKIKVYNSPEEYADALDKGSQNGGVAAIFDEMPYLKLLLKKYCGRYIRVGPIYRMEGFGFVFPKKSPLVSDVNRAILSVVEGAKMVGIETMWLGTENHCPEPSKHIASTKIHFKNLMWLFFCIYLIHILSVVPFVLAFIYRHSGNGIWKGLNNFYQIVPKSSAEAVVANVPIDESGTGPDSNREGSVPGQIKREDSGCTSDRTGSSSEIDEPASSSPNEIMPSE
ncbi:Glutamate receptor 2.2 [Thalictrum thalictroides]|uniref:Glutamate receptor 2.2 n=1 Tax=Thalictrum thalictroides TaxID=46969 RepID=A0A7J6WS29_THATH|nr:Glutamate receptor 2.2 [Thalictrum thalictroides]